MDPDGAGQVLVVRPPIHVRLGAWAIFPFGVLFGLAGLVGNGEGNVLALTMGLAGLCFASNWGALATASLRATPAGIRYWSWGPPFVATADVEALVVGAGSGMGYPRVRLTIRRKSGGVVRVTALQRAGTPDNRHALLEVARSIVNLLARPEITIRDDRTTPPGIL